MSEQLATHQEPYKTQTLVSKLGTMWIGNRTRLNWKTPISTDMKICFRDKAELRGKIKVDAYSK